jgi:hypothetical protein
VSYNQLVRVKQVIQAFEDSEITAIAMSEDSRLISVADISGYYVKVFDNELQVLLHTFYRGRTTALVNFISFEKNCLLVSSDRQTIHCFLLQETEEKKNSRGFLSILKSISGSFESIKSWAKMRLPELDY